MDYSNGIAKIGGKLFPPYFGNTIAVNVKKKKRKRKKEKDYGNRIAIIVKKKIKIK